MSDRPLNDRSISKEVHTHSDVDQDQFAQHHTLGTSPNQAAAGNHEHLGLGYTPIGGMIMYAAPSQSFVYNGTHWFAPLGQLLNTSDYPEYYALVGHTFNGGVDPGNGKFKLPNISDRSPVGAGPKALGTTGGSATHTLTESNLPAHSHSMVHTHSINHDHGSVNTGPDGAHSHTFPVSNQAGVNTFRAAPGVATITTNAPTSSANDHSHTVDLPNFVGSSGASSAANTGNTGGGTSVSHLDPWLAVNFLLRVK